MNCTPSDPQNLFDTYWLDWTYDIQRKYDLASPDEVRIIVLLKIEKKLHLLDRELSDFNFPVPTDDEQSQIAKLMKKQLATKDSIIRQEELDFDVEELKIDNAEKYKMLNDEQRKIYDEVLHLIRKGIGARYFIDAPDGTGKTFLLNTILSGIRTLKDEKNIAFSNIPGDEIILMSADATINNDDQTSFPVAFLNCQTPSGLPPDRLELMKIGMVLILLRKLNPRKGLYSGTRLILQKPSRLLLECMFASATNRRNSEKSVLIPMIELTMDKGDFPIQWKRHQFPVRPAFAMTINKSQGQTLKEVGLWLKEPCFTHGQFYVASSRVGRPGGLHIAMNKSDCGMTRNVVYKEALT